jgi:hypothetical protein
MVVISGYFIGGYYWLLIVILLLAINGYFVVGF